MPNARVFVTLDATISDEMDVQFPMAPVDIPARKLPLIAGRPHLNHVAIEAACTSAAFYARHRLKANVSVRLLGYRAEGDVENPMPFAVATTVAIYVAVSEIRDFTAGELEGWEVVSATRE